MFLVYDPNLLDEGQNQLVELNDVQTTVAPFTDVCQCWSDSGRLTSLFSPKGSEEKNRK